MEILLQRRVAAAAFIAGCAMARFEVEIFFVSPRVAAGLRSRSAVQPSEQPPGALLCADAQFDQLRALANRQPGIEPGPLEWLRRLHRASLDRHLPHAECFSR